jgi:predicted alpha/beta superfamily hydrolase
MKRALIGLALAAGGCAAAPEPSPQMNALRVPAAVRAASGFVQGQAAEFIVSQQFILHSEHVGGDYLIQVAIPIPRPTTEEMVNAKVDIVDRMFPNRDAAAVYVLDGGSDFPKYANYRDQYVVGVQPMFTTWQEIYDTRWRDLSHIALKNAPTSGGGAKFHAFLTKELKPFIEKTFPVDPKKAVLAGYSLGGMFVLRVLGDDPQAFAGYLVGDPSDFDKSIPERLRASAPRATGVRVYLGEADLDRPGVRPSHDVLLAALQAPGSGIVLKSQAFAGETHGSAMPFVIAKGMDWMFSAPPLNPAN